jgi:hypothetical protein
MTERSSTTLLYPKLYSEKQNINQQGNSHDIGFEKLTSRPGADVWVPSLLSQRTTDLFLYNALEFKDSTAGKEGADHVPPRFGLLWIYETKHRFRESKSREIISVGNQKMICKYIMFHIRIFNELWACSKYFRVGYWFAEVELRKRCDQIATTRSQIEKPTELGLYRTTGPNA